MSWQQIYNYILLATHPDDELVNMQYFFMMPDSHCVLVTGGDHKRRDKFEKVCVDHNVIPSVLEFVPGNLLNYDRKWVHYQFTHHIEGFFTEYGMNILVLPSTNDTHPEHNLVTMTGLRVFQEFKEISNRSNIDVAFSSTKNVETFSVEIPNKLDVIEKYYPEEYKGLINTQYGLTNMEYHS